MGKRFISLLQLKPQQQNQRGDGIGFGARKHLELMGLLAESLRCRRRLRSTNPRGSEAGSASKKPRRRKKKHYSAQKREMEEPRDSPVMMGLKFFNFTRLDN
ncbi:Hypothetical protein NTJ_02946 [Nesidiocoris tenuis]|uniref:Uncharacterized protein n=1 Tax=Nesidiocoris tenuis TaxID=355587 RepID=A0ABN7AFI7_9HEMI|nr:Hypothetical protein NTJ_02946 [Nesidiocoris tenuis]